MEQHNKNLKVKVAGGFLSLDEFLDQYTTIEFEKMDRVNTTYNKKMIESNGPNKLTTSTSLTANQINNK